MKLQKIKSFLWVNLKKKVLVFYLLKKFKLLAFCIEKLADCILTNIRKYKHKKKYLSKAFVISDISTKYDKSILYEKKFKKIFELIRFRTFENEKK